MPKVLVNFLLALGALAVAVLIRWALEPVLVGHLPLVTIFAAVAVGVWFGGYRLAVLITLAGYVICAYLFIDHPQTVGLGTARDWIGFVTYLFTCAIIIGLGEGMRAARRRAELREEILRVTLASMGDAVITTDAEARVTSLNNVAASLTGWTHESALGQPLETVFRIVNEETRKPANNPALRALSEGVIVGLANHTSLISKGGHEYPIDDSAAPIKDSDANTVGCVLIFRDITERRQHEREAAIQLTAARFLAAIVESSEDAIVSKSLDGIVQSWNAAAERIFGYSAAEAIGQHISFIIPADRRKEEDRIIAQIKSGGRVSHYETVRTRSDGQHIDVSLTVSPIRDDSGKVIGASKIARDISDRKRIDMERLRLASVVDNSTDFIGICDMGFVPYYINQAGMRLVGLDASHLDSRLPVSTFFFPEDRARIMEEFLPTVVQQGSGEIEVRFRHFQTGAPIWVLHRVFTLTDLDGTAIGLATVTRDITQRRKLEDDLRNLAAELSEANRRKDEFLAMLAHELRNPLAPILNGLNVLQLSISENGEVRQGIDMMKRQVGQMVRLIDDLLDVSRITRGKIELKRQWIDLSTIIRNAAETVRPICDTLGHQLRTSLPEEPLFVDCDSTRIAQVVDNLLSNACKFTEPGGTIWLALDQVDQTAVVRVKDTGAGINKDQLSRIFQMFTQLDSTLEKSRGGLGIGLSLAKTLVELHGGSIEAHSAGVGQGAEFVVTLPMASENSRSAESSSDAPAFTPSPPRKILVVDDNRDSAESLAMLLRLVGNDVSTAHDGLAAVERAEELRPDAILLDIGLPGMNGYEACRTIRQRPWGASVKLVALTGWGQEEDRRKSTDAGFDSHLVKPVMPDVLQKLLDELLRDGAGSAAAPPSLPTPAKS